MLKRVKKNSQSSHLGTIKVPYSAIYTIKTENEKEWEELFNEIMNNFVFVVGVKC